MPKGPKRRLAHPPPLSGRYNGWVEAEKRRKRGNYTSCVYPHEHSANGPVAAGHHPARQVRRNLTPSPGRPRKSFTAYLAPSTAIGSVSRSA